MRLAADLREAVYLSALNGSLSERRLGENTEQFHSSFSGEEPFPVPDSWKWCCFSDVVTIATNLVDPKDYQNYLQIAPDYIEKGTGILKPCNTVGANKIISKNHLFHAGQIIYSKIRPALRKTVIAPFDGLCSADMYPLETELNTHYLLFFLLSDFFTKKAVEKSAREKMPKINQKELGKLPIPVPPVEEQQRIVERVKELLPEINEYEEMENRLVCLKKAFPGNLRDAVLQAAVFGRLTEHVDREDSSYLVNTILKTKNRLLYEKAISRDNSCKTQPIDPADNDLPEIPYNWTWVRLGSLCSKIGAGSTPAGGSKVYVKSGIKFLREQNIHNSGLVMDGLVFITDEINASMKGSQVQAKDILVNITGASIGRNALVPDDFDVANVNQHVLIVRLIDARLRHYIHLCLQSPHIFNQMMDKQTGDKPGLSATKVANFLIPLPPIEEQQRIIDRLNTILPMCDELADVI